MHAQPRDTTRVAILCVQFADKDTNVDARGGVGYSPPPELALIEHKYRYGDYWNIIFQPTGNVVHPDAAFPDEYARGRRGFFQYGSLRRYMEDNSYGRHTIVPYRAWSGASGILNSLSPDSTSQLHRSYVNWLTLDTTKIKRFDDPVNLGIFAIRTAKDSLDIALDSIDVIIIYYAGENTFGYSKAGTYTDSEDTVRFAISSERVGSGIGGVFCFIYPRVVFHEFLHAAIDAKDLHYRNGFIVPESLLCTGVGHFSIMGDSAPLAAYTPEMLDPWHKLRRGWLRYYVPDAAVDSMNLSSPVDTLNFQLPLVEEPYNGAPPYVLVIPVTKHPDVDGWEDHQQRYIIVENRRAIGWDSVIVTVEMAKESELYGTRSGTGGFMIWGVSDPYGIPAWVYDADGDFGTWTNVGLYGAPEDLFDGSPGRNIFSIWSSPGPFHAPYPRNGSKLLYVSRNLFIEFAPYVDSSNVNPISRLIIDRFVPAEHEYSLTGGEDLSSTKFSSQHKIDVGDTLTLATFQTAGRTWVVCGESVEELRNVTCLNYIIDEPGIEIDNSAIANYPDTSSGLGMFAATYLWQQHKDDGNYVRTWRVNRYIDQSLSGGRYTWGPFQQAPHPVITSRGDFAALAFASDSGVCTSTSTNKGVTWTIPALLPGSAPGSGSPCILMDSEVRGDSAWLLAFVNRVGDVYQIWLHRSSTSQTVKLSDVNQTDCANPNASRLGDKLSVVYQYHDDNQNINRNYVARIEVDLSQADPPNDRDAFGFLKQDIYDVNRDPAILYTDSSDAGNTVLYWVLNKGEALYSTARDSQHDSLNGWFQGMGSALSSKPTSYPHLLYHEPGNPKLVVSRTGTFQSARWGIPFVSDTTPSVIVMTRNQDLDADPNLLLLATQVGMNFKDGGANSMMHGRWGTPVVVRASDTIAIVHYDYYATKDFSSAVMDSLSRTQILEMTDEDVAIFALDLSMSQAAPDTMVFESQLVDVVSGQGISGSGEIKIPPMTGDTTVYVGLELPNGFPPTDCFIVTSMTRGYYQTGELPRLDLTRYMLYSPEVVPKRHPQVSQALPHSEALRTYPQPASNELRFVVEGAVSEATRAQLYDLLGRRVADAPLLYNGRSAHGSMQIQGLVPGMYILTVPGPNGVRTAKVLVAK